MISGVEQTRITEKPSLLFVDDEPSILMAVKVVFRIGYSVALAGNGNDALELLRKQRFHVVVSDQRMPNMTGVQLLEQVRLISPNTVRILLTGYSDSDAIITAINEVEVHRFLQKPWDNAKLKRVIDESISLATHLFASERMPATATTFSSAQKKSADIIQLPLACPAETSSANTGWTEFATYAHYAFAEGPETVLILDNKTDLYASVKKELGPKAKVLHASNTAELFVALSREPISVIACSFDPQSETDRAFLQILKKEQPYIIVIAICDSTDSPYLIELINQARIFRFIRKPVSLGLLSRYITSAVNHVKEINANPVLIGRQSSEGVSEEIDNSVVSLQLRDQISRANRTLSAHFATFMRLFKSG